MDERAEVIAYHGWGFDSTCWQSWQSWLNHQGFTLKPFDRGYFGNSVRPVFAQPSPKVILAHSYGLHLCTAEQLQLTDLLVVFSSFSQFHPHQEPSRTRSTGILQQMIQQFQQNPQQVLNKFKSKCYHPLPWSKTQNDLLNEELLLQDLKNLDVAILNLEPLKSLPNIVIFQGSQDRIVSPAKGQELAEALPANSHYFEIEAGHALPFTHPQLCWILLEPILQKLLIDADHNPFSTVR